ncbi:MAG: C40 family peptidase [Acidaminococcaceae bacterium]|nr:C40 family peptidase [Acidaminococcaceae bacterium]
MLRKNAKQETEKSVYKVGDKGWKVKQAQQYLQKLGYDPGGTDGQFTKAMRKALRKFQKQHKLKETGTLDNTTYQELKWQAEAKEYGGNVASAKILKTAAQYKGVPYVFGGTTPRGFDCSGYVQYVFAKHGVRLTRTADTQALEGKYVSRKALRPGDLVFFTTYEPGASHVGIYAGNNRFWNATSSRGIMLSDLTDSYWGPRYYTARRILTEK